ncbi:hypothetical protein ACFW2V_05955 [Streptomyces sp. NPDC058947]|uniref:hypothetical protein n=1 Tax=Streptomyces sp. NPDC058947 TaxID=3346675 RepID=UPI0036C4DE05
MGEHRSDGGLPGRRQVHPADPTTPPGRPAPTNGDRPAGQDRPTGHGRSAGPDRATGSDRPAAHDRATGPDRPTGSDQPAAHDWSTGHDRPTGHHRSTGLGSPNGPGSAALREAELEVLLAAALIHGGIDAEAEQRAVAAFRAARQAGAQQGRTRHRDDWRPRERRLPGRSLKATLSVLLASLTLGGVAVAAIGSVATDDSGEPARPPASTRAPGPSAGGATDAPAASGSASAHPDRPGTARDTEAHCRAYERVGGRGKALDATAWQRLIEAAGGERKVTAYCAEQLARAEEKAGGTAAPGKGEGTPGSGNANGGPAAEGNGRGGVGRGADAQEGDPDTGGSGSGGNGSGAAGDGAQGTEGIGSSSGQGKPDQSNDRRP